LTEKKEKNMHNKIAIIFSIFLMSCDLDIQYIEYNSIDGEAWHKDSIQYFNFEIESAEKATYNSYINLRINNDYKFNNIFLIVSLSNSSQLISKDTLEFTLADKRGNLLGEKSINIIDNSLIHKENISLDHNKAYSVSVEHAMRIINKVKPLEYLEGVIDVGYKVEKVN